jgi:hypothetical protein
MGILSENSLVGASYKSGEHYDYKIDNSLRFNDNDSAYLSWTPTTAGNRKTWTWSGWVKRGNIDATLAYMLFDASTADTNGSIIEFGKSAEGDTALNVVDYQGGERIRLRTNMKFRDVSAWYHIVVAVDTTQATSTDRVKIYVNGEQQTSLAQTTYPSQNHDTLINSTNQHRHGRWWDNRRFYDGYLAEVNFIDGQALTPSDFGEADADYGDWKPKEYTGTHGTNGFYLPFKHDATIEGFSAVAYSGNGGVNKIDGLGYEPDLMWFKARDVAQPHQIYDSVRGLNKELYPSLTGAENPSSGDFDSVDTDGFTLNTSDNEINSSSNTYIAWTWDMGGTTVSNTNGSTTSSVRANSAYGQSIVSYTGTGANATVGHGLSSAPEFMMIKNRGTAGTEWFNYHKDLGNNQYIHFNNLSSNAAGTHWQNTPPSSTVFSIGTGGDYNQSTKSIIAYCFHSVAGYSKFGGYTGDATTSNSITGLGFRPAFLMIKRTNGGGNWATFDNARTPNNPNGYPLNANRNNIEDPITTVVDFDADGFTWKHVDAEWNGLNDSYIYIAFADTREYSFFTDQSTNSNHWTPNNISSTADVMLDSPTNNFCTWNPLYKESQITLSEGNTKYSIGATGWNGVSTTHGMSSGKWYVELLNTTTWDTVLMISPPETPMTYNGSVSSTGGYGFWSDDQNTYKASNGLGSNGSLTGASAINAGDILMCAFDADNGKMYFGKNGTWWNSSNPSTSTSPSITGIDVSGTWVFRSLTEQNKVHVINFGQDSSFAGNKTAQGNQDSNAIGDFYYTPPSGFLALCTANLPDPTVIPSKHFNTVTYAGNGTARTISGVGFQPDWNWTKPRNNIGSHVLTDSVRGNTKFMESNSTYLEQTGSTGITGFNSDGYTLGTGNDWNVSADTFVSWNWKAGGTAVSNTNGTITSSVSANVDAGFSIVSYTGTGSGGATLGHGLASAPEMVIVKNRSISRDWQVHRALNKRLVLNDSVPETTDSLSISNFGASTITWAGGNSINNSTDAFIAYCFHSVDGYSKVGSYTGNSSTDGTFVYTGFKPAYVMIKNTQASAGSQWVVKDSDRSPNNPVDERIRPNDNSAETTGADVDFTSNGIKIRSASGEVNTSGDNYMFLAFAEMPSRWARGR